MENHGGCVKLLTVAPPLRRADEAEGNQAEPEIDQQAQVDLKQLVPGGLREGGHKNVIGCIPQQHRQERLQVVRDH
jgi:hypothetical protein